MKKTLIVLLVFSISACTSSRGFDRGSLHNQLTSQKPITEADIQKTMALKPQLSFPFKLAVYFGSSEWRGGNWTAEDKNKLLDIAGDLKHKNSVSEMFALNDSLIEGERNTPAIRLAATRMGADAVLIINGVSDVDKYNNPLAATYFLGITPFFVPGTVVDALYIMDASMWDVRNQYLYLTAEAESSASETRPAFFSEQSRVVKSAKTTAISALAKEIADRLNHLNKK